MINQALREYLKGIRISMAEVGKPTQNGFAERLMRTLKEEAVDLSNYEDYDQDYQQIGRFLDDVYMRKRVHSSLNYLTPVEFEARWSRPSGINLIAIVTFLSSFLGSLQS